MRGTIFFPFSPEHVVCGIKVKTHNRLTLGIIPTIKLARAHLCVGFTSTFSHKKNEALGAWFTSGRGDHDSVMALGKRLFSLVHSFHTGKSQIDRIWRKKKRVGIFVSARFKCLSNIFFAREKKIIAWVAAFIPFFQLEVSVSRDYFGPWCT